MTITKMFRVHEKFDKEAKDILRERIKLGKEKSPAKPKATMGRITLAMVRHPLFPKIKEDITLADLKEEKLLK